jgi:hypothetical protein
MRHSYKSSLIYHASVFEIILVALSIPLIGFAEKNTLTAQNPIYKTASDGQNRLRSLSAIDP